VARGFAPGKSTVTVFGISGMVEVVDSGSADAEGVLTTLANSMTIAGTVGGAATLGSGEPLILLAPEHAAIIARQMGRAEAQAFLWRHARLPLSCLGPHVRERVLAAQEADGPGDGKTIPVARRPEDVQIAVVGGVGQKSTYVPTWGGGTRSITRAVEA
jgi:hypothetical protein